MNWVVTTLLPCILCLLMFAAIAGFYGVMIVALIDAAFAKMTGYIRIGFEPSQEKLERKIQDPELLYELKMLLAEKRMGRWWQFLVWLIVSVAFFVFFLTR